MRQRFRAIPRAESATPIRIGIQLRRSDGLPPPRAAPTGDGGVPGIAQLTVSPISPATVGATCTYIIEAIDTQPGISATFSATWDDMGGGGPAGEFVGGGTRAAVFSATDPMTNLVFYATLSDGAVLQSSPLTCA